MGFKPYLMTFIFMLNDIGRKDNPITKLDKYLKIFRNILKY